VIPFFSIHHRTMSWTPFQKAYLPYESLGFAADFSRLERLTP
jgi:hypothetical protein